MPEGTALLQTTGGARSPASRRKSGPDFITKAAAPPVGKFPTGGAAKSERAAFIPGRALFLVLVQEAALLQVLALEAVPGPRHGVEPLLGQGLPAVDALAVLAALHALQRLVNQL